MWAVIAVAAPAVGAAAQDASDPPYLSNQDSIRMSDEKLEHFHVADMPLSSALRMLSVQSRRNIVASPDVKGTVTANWNTDSVPTAAPTSISKGDYVDLDLYLTTGGDKIDVTNALVGDFSITVPVQGLVTWTFAFKSSGINSYTMPT